MAETERGLAQRPRCALIRNPPNNTSDNKQHFDHSSEGNGGQIHNVVIGLAPALWMLGHLNDELNDKWPTS